MLTRLRAWWVGAENAEIFARYGERSAFDRISSEWSSVGVAFSAVACLWLSVGNVKYANECTENAERNRMRFYKRDLAPEYIAKAPEGLYSGATGYTSVDPASGFKVGIDGRFQGPNREELQRQWESKPPPITDEMMASIKMLHGSMNASKGK